MSVLIRLRVRALASKMVAGIRAHRTVAIGALLITTSSAIAAAFVQLGLADADTLGEQGPNPAEASAAGGPLVLTIDELPPYQPDEANPGVITRQAELNTILPERPRVLVIRYTVQQGDTLFGIAERFGLRPETLLWGNFEVLQDNPHSLRPGQELRILPVDGTYYEWQAGNGLDGIASFFGVTAQDILDWPGNNLAQDLDRADPGIAAGTGLVVPGGTREFVSWRAPRITRANPAAASIAGPGACGSVYDGPIGEGFFIWPTTGTTLSGYGYSDFHPGIDIGGSTGNAVYASASGVIVYAGWNNYGYGNVIVIDHGDSWQTLYAHLDRVNVGCGQPVFQGNVIGGVGSTGNSTGSHLHFELESDSFGKVNPYNFVSP